MCIRAGLRLCFLRGRQRIIFPPTDMTEYSNHYDTPLLDVVVLYICHTLGVLARLIVSQESRMAMNRGILRRVMRRFTFLCCLDDYRDEFYQGMATLRVRDSEPDDT